MTLIEEFKWFVLEREMVRTAKEYGRPHPLTEDPRLRDYRFPNIRREDDPTNVWFRAEVRAKLTEHPIDLLYAVVAFRLFSKITTGEKLRDMMLKHGYERKAFLSALGGLSQLANTHLSPGTLPRSLDAALNVMEQLQRREDIPARLESNSLQRAFEALQELSGVGPALAYEIVCDLRHTWWLKDATDIDTWAAPTAAACNGVGVLLGTEVRATRAADRRRTINWMIQLRSNWDGWEMAEAHRALCLFYYWKRPETPLRRYRWK